MKAYRVELPRSELIVVDMDGSFKIITEDHVAGITGQYLDDFEMTDEIEIVVASSLDSALTSFLGSSKEYIRSIREETFP